MSADRHEVAAESEQVGNALIQQGEYLLQLGKELIKQSALLRDEKPQAVRREIHGPDADHSVGVGGLVDQERAHGVARDLKKFTRNTLGDALGLKGVQVSKWLAHLLDAGVIERQIDEETNATVYVYVRSLEDEDALYQLRQWAQGVGVAFSAEQAIEALDEPEDEVYAALAQLLTENVLRTEVVEEVHGLDEVDQLGQKVYRYAPPLPAGLAGKMERQRLELVTSTPEVPRGEPVRIRTERKTARARSTPGSRGKVKRNEAAWQRQQEAKEERRRKNQAMAAKNGRRRDGKPKS